MKERPILFSGPMVRAILDGNKRMTRRVLKPQPAYPDSWDSYRFVQVDGVIECYSPGASLPNRLLRCPYGIPGDRLWVRETWNSTERFPGPDNQMFYRADTVDMECGDEQCRWLPSIFMPRWASRITLEIAEVRVERLQAISEEDAKAEGIQVLPLQSSGDPSAWYQSAPGVHQARSARDSFRLLWESINAKRGFGWNANPWVWVVSFKRVEASHG